MRYDPYRGPKSNTKSNSQLLALVSHNHDKIWYFQDGMSSRASVGLCAWVLLSAMLLVQTVTYLIVREWRLLRWHNTSTRFHQNSSSDCGDETWRQQADKHGHTIRATAPQWATASSLSRLHDHRLTRNTVGLLWTSDQPDAETSTWRRTALTRDQYLFL